TAMIKKSSLRPVLRVTDLLRSTSSARLIPSGVSSNAQARISAIGKPSAITATKTFIVHGGASKVGNKIDAACSNSHATIAQAIATLYTSRRFGSATYVG